MKKKPRAFSSPQGEVAVAARKPGAVSTNQERTGVSGFDRTAFAQIYQEHVTRIYRYAIARVYNHADAEDITAQVFMSALQRIDRLERGANITAWLFTIARNKVVDSYRKNKGKQMLDLDEVANLYAGQGDLLAAVEKQEMTQRLADELAALDLEQQELLRLRFAAELSFAQIALVLNKSEAAVKMATYRLLDQLQKRMEQ